MIGKTNTLSPLCITKYIYIYTYIYTPEFDISLGSTAVKIYPFVSLCCVNKDKNM